MLLCGGVVGRLKEDRARGISLEGALTQETLRVDVELQLATLCRRGICDVDPLCLLSITIEERKPITNSKSPNRKTTIASRIEL